MYFKCTSQDGKEIYKSLDEKTIRSAINIDELQEIIEFQTGDSVEDEGWEFTDIQSKHANIVDVDLRKIINIEELHAILEEECSQIFEKVEFLEDFSYEHSLASLSLSDPKNIYKKRVLYEPAPIDIDQYDYEDPYSDDPS